MKNLKPLKWVDTSEGMDKVYCEETDSYIENAILFCSTPVADYVIRTSKFSKNKFIVTYEGRTWNEFPTLDDAVYWCEHIHYKDKMKSWILPYPNKVFELVYNFGPNYISLLTTLDKQKVINLIDEVNTDIYNIMVWKYDETHPLNPYTDQIWNDMKESLHDGVKPVINMSIIEHDLI